jgi:hypothetical protein
MILQDRQRLLEHKEISIKKKRDHRVTAEKPSENRLDIIRGGPAILSSVPTTARAVGLLVEVGGMRLLS